MRLADDHRIEAGRDAKQVPHGVVLPVLVQIRFVHGRIEIEVLPEKLAKVGAPICGLGKNFDTIAGGKNQGFAYAGNLQQLLQGFRNPAVGNGQPLSHLDRSGLVIETEQLKVHGRRPSS